MTSPGPDVEMIPRFSLYGFLKNQRYFEPFWVLAFLDKGLSFFMIGLLFGFREVATNLMEIPSGAVADVWGRRRSMILSFLAYIVSFTIFGLAESVPLLFAAMFFFSVGDSFRTGTHKAMIFTWLRIQGRTDERVRVYGFTRSWSKTGSAVSVLIAAALVFLTGDYRQIFFWSIVPYVLGLVNFLGYPKELEGEREGERRTLSGVARHLGESLSAAFRKKELRGLVLESMGFEGLFKASKDYIQPILQGAAVIFLSAQLAGWNLTEAQETALLAGPVFFVLFILAAAASRNAHRLVERFQGKEDRTAGALWLLYLLAFGALLPAMVFEIHLVMIAGFMVLHLLQNLWRPVLVSRFDSHGSESHGATLLSIESQAKSAATMILAPVLGLAVDLARAGGQAGGFWPVGAAGALVAGLFLLRSRAR